MLAESKVPPAKHAQRIRIRIGNGKRLDDNNKALTATLPPVVEQQHAKADDHGENDWSDVARAFGVGDGGRVVGFKFLL